MRKIPIKLEKIIDDESLDISYKIKKSFFSTLTLTEEELKKLQQLIIRQIGDIE